MSIFQSTMQRRDQISCEICGLWFKNRIALGIHYDENHRNIDSIHTASSWSMMPEFSVNQSTYRLPTSNQSSAHSHESLPKFSIPPINNEYKHVLPPRTQPIENRDEFIAANTLYNPGKSTWDCCLCRKSFREKNDLYQHLRSGTHEAKRFACSTCGRTFASIGSLTQHAEQSGHSDQSHKIQDDHSNNDAAIGRSQILHPAYNNPYDVNYPSSQKIFPSTPASIPAPRDFQPVESLHWRSVPYHWSNRTDRLNSLATSKETESPSSEHFSIELTRLSDPRVSDMSLVGLNQPRTMSGDGTTQSKDFDNSGLRSNSDTSASSISSLLELYGNPTTSGFSGIQSFRQPLEYTHMLTVCGMASIRTQRGSFAYVLTDALTGSVVYEHRQFVQEPTIPGSLVPEYEALYAGLMECLRRGVRRVCVCSDSSHVFSHLNTGASPKLPTAIPSLYSLPRNPTYSAISNIPSGPQPLSNSLTQEQIAQLERITEGVAQQVRKCCAQLERVKFEVVDHSAGSERARVLASTLLTSEL